MNTAMNVCIVGLGAVGGLIAAWLGQHLPPGRIRLSTLARGATLAAVQRNGGLRLIGGSGAHATGLGVGIQVEGGADVIVPLYASSEPRELGPQDLVVLAVKGPSLASAAPLAAALCSPRTQVLAPMNGVPWWFFEGLPGPCTGLVLDSVDPGGVVSRLLPSGQVIGCVVHVSSATPGPGSVRHVNGHGLVVGRPAGGGDPALSDVAGLLSEAGFAVTVSERVQRDVWFKLWGNLTMNPVSALTGAPCDRILDDPLVRAFCSAVMLEAQAIGAALGLPIDGDPESRHAVTRRLGSFKTSMLQDAEAGRPLELDALAGAAREIGQHLGLATPNIDALFGLTRLMARERGLYPAGGTGPA